MATNMTRADVNKAGMEAAKFVFLKSRIALDDEDERGMPVMLGRRRDSGSGWAEYYQSDNDERIEIRYTDVLWGEQLMDSIDLLSADKKRKLADIPELQAKAEIYSSFTVGETDYVCYEKASSYLSCYTTDEMDGNDTYSYYSDTERTNHKTLETIFEGIEGVIKDQLLIVSEDSPTIPGMIVMPARFLTLALLEEQGKPVVVRTGNEHSTKTAKIESHHLSLYTE